jgi:sec-independent protein translocase protein TatB
VNSGELLLVLLIAVIVVGPTRLPKYAEQLAVLVRRGRVLVRDAKEKVGAELGEAGTDLDWEALDPRRYDPRRIVREALADELSSPPTRAAQPAPRATGPSAGAPAVFDDEAT